jgi:hypothetical protein
MRQGSAQDYRLRADRAFHVSHPAAAAPGGLGRRPSRPLLWPVLTSGLGGFVIGAIVWHFVGFWSFLTHVVLKGPGAEQQVSHAAPALLGTLVTGSSERAGKRGERLDPAQMPAAPLDSVASCLAAARNGQGEVALTSCPEPYAVFVSGEGAGRGDLEAIPTAAVTQNASWATAVRQEPGPATAGPGSLAARR